MSIDATIARWEEENLLEDIYAELARILTAASFTREQVATCFDTMKGNVYWTDAPVGREFTLDEYRRGFLERLKDETAIVELCMQVTHDIDRPEREVLSDLERSIENRKWLDGLNED